MLVIIFCKEKIEMLHWTKGNVPQSWVLVNNGEALAEVMHQNSGWVFENHCYRTLEFAKRAVITILVYRGEL